MAVYTFYCCNRAGAPTSFVAHDLPSDRAAQAKAGELFAEHRSCARVIAYQGDRHAFDVDRAGGEAPPAADRGTAALEAVRAVLRARAGETVAVIATQADGAILFWNRGARRLYGWRETEAIGRNIIEVTPAVQSRAEATAIMETLRTGQPWAGEIVLRKADGTPFRAFVVDLPVATAAGPAEIIVGVSAATERRSAVEAYGAKLQQELAALV